VSADQISFLLYLILPFAASLVPKQVEPSAWLSKGAATTLARILLLLALGREVVLLGGEVAFRAPLVAGYPIELFLGLDSYRYVFLLSAEFCFLLAHWMCPGKGPGAGMIRLLVSFAQGLCSLFLVSSNAAATGAFLLLAGTVFFYLVRFAVPAKDEGAGAAISTRMHTLFFLLGLLVIAWGIAEFSSGGLVFGRGTGALFGLPLWLLLVVLSVPLPPWSRWLARAVETLPEGVTLTLVTFLSAVSLKAASLFSVAYPDLGWKQKLLFYLLGLLGCALSIGGLFAARGRRAMLSCLPGFFFCMVLVSVGVSRNTLVLAAYFSCLFVPVFTGLVLSSAVMGGGHPLQKLFLGLLFTHALGVPGTPVFQIFSQIGARSLDLGIGYTITLGLLWFFYFNANVSICRRIFMEQGAPEASADVVRLDGTPGFLAGYGLFLMFMVIIAAQVAGRVL